VAPEHYRTVNSGRLVEVAEKRTTPYIPSGLLHHGLDSLFGVGVRRAAARSDG